MRSPLADVSTPSSASGSPAHATKLSSSRTATRMPAPPSPSRRTRRSSPMRLATHRSRPASVSNARACTSRGTETSVARRGRPDAAYRPPHHVPHREPPAVLVEPGLRRVARMMEKAVVDGRRAENQRSHAPVGRTRGDAQVPGGAEQAALARIVSAHGNPAAVRVGGRPAAEGTGAGPDADRTEAVGLAAEQGSSGTDDVGQRLDRFPSPSGRQRRARWRRSNG